MLRQTNAASSGVTGFIELIAAAFLSWGVLATRCDVVSVRGANDDWQSSSAAAGHEPKMSGGLRLAVQQFGHVLHREITALKHMSANRAIA
jgi:hypothetical protein